MKFGKLDSLKLLFQFVGAIIILSFRLMYLALDINIDIDIDMDIETASTAY